jgi:Putative prokaryotic signal transducing protein
MKTVLETNNVVLLSLAEAVLKDAAIACVVLDAHMAVMDGSIGAIPRRLCVPDAHEERARALVEALDNGTR